MSKQHWTVSEVVAAEYCEQKAVYDQRYGDRPNPHIQQLRKVGESDHLRFEKQGRSRMAQDRRCFIATSIYGPAAPQTDFLRQWRDLHLSPSAPGRATVAAYYRLSPALVDLFTVLPGLKWIARVLLSRIVRFLGGPA
jgi:hypothetical protein